jgi:TIR domain
MNSSPLFSRLDGYSVMEGQKNQLKAALAAAPDSMTSLSDDDVVNQYVSKFELDIPRLLEADKTMSEREVDVDVSHDPRRVFFEHRGPFYLKGTEFTVHIPFTGEGVLFDVQPNFWSSSMPRGEVHGQELMIRFTFPNDSPPADLKGELDRLVVQINQFLDRLREMATQLQTELLGIARQAWQQRKSQFATRSQLAVNLGIPRRHEPTPSAKHPSASGPPTTGAARQSPKRQDWDAFISHASEDKEAFVKPLAESLRAKGLRIWYDEYALTIGDSLRQKIDEGLTRSRFGVVVLSPAFFAKHWPQQELNGLAAREVAGIKVILPVWHEMGRDDVAAFSPTLADRIAAKSSGGLEAVVQQILDAVGRG